MLLSLLHSNHPAVLKLYAHSTQPHPRGMRACEGDSCYLYDTVPVSHYISDPLRCALTDTNPAQQRLFKTLFTSSSYHRCTFVVRRFGFLSTPFSPTEKNECLLTVVWAVASCHSVNQCKNFGLNSNE